MLKREAIHADARGNSSLRGRQLSLKQEANSWWSGRQFSLSRKHIYAEAGRDLSNSLSIPKQSTSHQNHPTQQTSQRTN